MQRWVRWNELPTHRWICALVAAALVACGVSPATAASAVQVNFRPYFNADVVVNGTTGAFDTTMGSIEGQWSFATASAGGSSCGGPWLPDDAFFPATASHPDAQLGWNQANDGLNAWQTFDTSGTITVPVPDLHYDTLYLYATGAWETSLTVQLNYRTGAPDSFAGIAYPSWFDPTPPGFFELVHGQDRAKLDGSGVLVCEDVNNPGILGRAFPADPTRVLESFSLTRTDNDQGVLNVFGATAAIAREVFDYDMTSHFNGDVVANASSCAIPDRDQVHDGLEFAAFGVKWHIPTATLGACSGSQPGLPDDGFFPANDVHPAFQLAYSNASNGLNAHITGPTADAYVIDVPDKPVDEVHLFGTSGGGFADFIVELRYTSDLPTSYIGVFLEDWLYDGPFSQPYGATTYYLIDGLDKHSAEGGGWTYAPVHDVAVFGIRFNADPSRTLTEISIERLDPSGFPVPQSTMAILGAAGVVKDDSYVFVDRFETGDESGWSSSLP